MQQHITFTGQDDSSGKPQTAFSRDRLIDQVRKAGHVYHSSICSKSTLLVASEEALQKPTRKVKLANAQGVDVISYGNFFRRLRDERNARVDSIAA